MVNYNDGKWHGWNGGECPVHPETVVEVQYNRRETHTAKKFVWSHSLSNADIVAFRVIKEHREPREWWLQRLDSGELVAGITEVNGAIKVREVI